MDVMTADPRRDVFPLRFKNPQTRDALRRIAEMTGQSMTDIAERAIEHEVVLLAADLEERLEAALDTVRRYRPDTDQGASLDAWLDAAADGEASDLGPGLRVVGPGQSARPGRPSTQLAHGAEALNVLAAFTTD